MTTTTSEVEVELDPQQFVTRPQGRRAWLREGRRALEAPARARRRARSRRTATERLFEACRRLEQELDVEQAANAAYEPWRARGVAADGSRRMAPGMVKPYELPVAPTGLINVTDHDSRVVRTQGQPPLQGYNAQLAVNDRQIIVAAEITDRVTGLRASRTDGPRHPTRTAPRIGLGDPEVVLADAGYWHQRQIATDRQRRHPGARPARRRAAQGRPAGLDRRHLRRSCAACSRRPTAATSTANARSPSSRCSARSSSTARSNASNAAAEPPAAANGD